MYLTQRKKVVAALGIAVVMMALVSYGLYIMCFAGVCPGPSLVEDLESGSVTSAEIARLEFLQFNVREGSPFKEQDYASMPRRQVASRETIAEFVAILKRFTTARRPSKTSHPVIYYDGIIRVELLNGEFYYLYYSLAYRDGVYYTYVSPNSKGSVNVNGATHLMNRPFAEFLQRHDPWFPQDVRP